MKQNRPVPSPCWNALVTPPLLVAGPLGVDALLGPGLCEPPTPQLWGVTGRLPGDPFPLLQLPRFFCHQIPILGLFPAVEPQDLTIIYMPVLPTSPGSSWILVCQQPSTSSIMSYCRARSGLLHADHLIF